jgi:hypothetical protein
MSEYHLDGRYTNTGELQDLDKRLRHMSPSSKLKLYAQLLLTAQRFFMNDKYSDADTVRKDADVILLHFETTID